MLIIMLIITITTICFTNLEIETSWNIWKFKQILKLLTINYFCHNVKNILKNLAVFTTQDCQSMFDLFSTLCMKELTAVRQSPRYPSNCGTTWKVSVFRVFLVRLFPHLDWIRRDARYLSVFNTNTEKYWPEKLRKGHFSRSAIIMVVIK